MHSEQKFALQVWQPLRSTHRHVQLVLGIQPPLRLHGGLQLVDVHVQGHRLQLVVSGAHPRVARLGVQHARQDGGPLLDPLSMQLKVLLDQPVSQQVRETSPKVRIVHISDTCQPVTTF